MALCQVLKYSGDFISWCHADLQTEPEDVYEAFIKYKERLSNEKLLLKDIEQIEIYLIIYLHSVCQF